MPIFETIDNTTRFTPYLHTKLAQIENNPSSESCAEIAISFVVPRLRSGAGYSQDEFISNTFNNFADYHADAKGKRTQFKNESLYLSWDNNIELSCGQNLTGNSVQKTLPETKIYNTQHQTFKEALAQKYAFHHYFVHGSPVTQGLGITDFADGDTQCSSIYTHVDNLREYSRLNPNQFLFVSSISCENSVLDDGYLNESCCFPQAYLEIGSWAYFFFPIGIDSFRGYDYLLSRHSIADTIRTYRIDPIIFGDILATF